MLPQHITTHANQHQHACQPADLLCIRFLLLLLGCSCLLQALFQLLLALLPLLLLLLLLQPALLASQAGCLLPCLLLLLLPLLQQLLLGLPGLLLLLVCRLLGRREGLVAGQQQCVTMCGMDDA